MRCFSVILLMLAPIAFSGCSSMRKVFALQSTEAPTSAPIGNPFVDQSLQQQKPQNMVLRTKKGDRSIEVELPQSGAGTSELVIPMSPYFGDGGERSPASSGVVDDRYRERRPSSADREILGHFPQSQAVDEAKRRGVEEGLGVAPLEDAAPEADASYLAAIDRVKQLFRLARYEAALLEIDQLLYQYQTSPQLYEMRGTVMDRLGYADLAVKSWDQALRLDPNNASLRAFVQRRQKPGAPKP